VSLTFALVSKTPLVRERDLYKLAQALELNAQHCAAAWGLEAPAVEVMDDDRALPRRCHPVVFVADTDADPGALAVHYYDVLRGGPAAVIYVDRATAFNDGHSAVSELAAHEVTESLCNPRANVWLPMPGRPGVQVVQEVADPVQTSYMVRAAGTSFLVANFVHPSWFSAAALDEEMRLRVLRGAGFDHARQLSQAATLHPEGYVVLRAIDAATGKWSYWFEDAAGKRFGASPSKATTRNRPTARCQTLVAVAQREEGGG
jgi:hypothetical protein